MSISASPPQRDSNPPSSPSILSLNSSIKDEDDCSSAFRSLLSDFSLTFHVLITRLRFASHAAADRRSAHASIQSALVALGRELGFRPASEIWVTGGRLDIAWFDAANKLLAAFEIDYKHPRDKSLQKLLSLESPLRCIILRVGECSCRDDNGVYILTLGQGVLPEETVGTIAPHVTTGWLDSEAPMKDSLVILSCPRCKIANARVLHNGERPRTIKCVWCRYESPGAAYTVVKRTYSEVG